jgi:hypothetical protein
MGWRQAGATLLVAPATVTTLAVVAGLQKS